MLLEFSCSNFKSIKDKVTFSMVAGKNHPQRKRLKRIDGHTDVLQIAAIYGANGSGKSNLIDAMRVMKQLVDGSMCSNDIYMMDYSYKQQNRNIPTEFQMIFIADGRRYTYGFALKDGAIEHEYLYYLTPNKTKHKLKNMSADESVGKSIDEPTVIFDRHKSVIIDASDEFRRSLKGRHLSLSESKLILRDSSSICGNLDLVKSARDFFEYRLQIYYAKMFDVDNYGLLEIVNQLFQIYGAKKVLLDILNAYGTRIVDIENKNTDSGKTVEVTYDDGFRINILHESKGIKKIIWLVCLSIRSMMNGDTLLIDDLDVNLHELILNSILSIFSVKPDSKFSQLIFTAHNTSLLSNDLLYKDQIWFINLKEQERITELYSLLEIKEVKKTENYRNRYLLGAYGAIPVLIVPNNIEKDQDGGNMNVSE